MGTVDVDDLVGRAGEGSPRALAKLITLVENASPCLREVMAATNPLAGHAQVIGLTGAPGVGKSTSTSALVTAFRKHGRRVGVLAVDPSSPFTGGALLGDRVRMQDHATDPEVFIRSMASRGHLGGLAWATPQAIRVLDAAGCEVILVETVGVGQAEVEVASLADSTIVLVAPGMGDSIQAAKAGILEVADVFVVNKADRDGARQTVRDLRNMIAMADTQGVAGRSHGGETQGVAGRGHGGGVEAGGLDGWKPPVVSTVASRGEGIGEVMETLDKHYAWLAGSGALRRRRLARARGEVEAIALTALRERMGDPHGHRLLDALADQVLDGRLDPYSAADELVHAITATPRESGDDG